MIIADRRHLHAEFRQMRLHRKLTQEQLAAKVYVSRRAVAYRETNSRASMDIDAVLRTAWAFGYDVALIPTRRRGSRPTGTGWPT